MSNVNLLSWAHAEILDNPVAVPTNRCPWAYLILVRQLLPLPNCQRAKPGGDKKRLAALRLARNRRIEVQCGGSQPGGTIYIVKLRWAA